MPSRGSPSIDFNVNGAKKKLRLGYGRAEKLAAIQKVLSPVRPELVSLTAVLDHCIDVTYKQVATPDHATDS